MLAANQPTTADMRFRVGYRLAGPAGEARARAEAITLEQTVEFPAELLPPEIRQGLVGQIEAFEPGDGACRVVISYPVETAGGELPQLLNVIFGNSSLQPGVRVELLDLPEPLLRAFRGPRFGRAGLRARLGVPRRPLLCTALKPMGLSPQQLAEQAYQFALGGIDLIKDDHGLANQPFAPFDERVPRCAQAVSRANLETGRNCLYIANLVAPADRIVARAHFAKRAGAGGLMLLPGLSGFDVMRQLADDDDLALPILSHPAWQGSFVTQAEGGVSHAVLFGQIARLAGADATIYPNYGGRFSFTRDECRSIAAGTALPMGHVKPSFPAPGGGMRLERVPEMIALYGSDVILLIGSALHQSGPDLIRNCRSLRQAVEAQSA